MAASLQAVGSHEGEARPINDSPEMRFIEEIKQGKIQSFLGTIDGEGNYLDPVYRSNRNLAATIASDYRDRFLIELIQNAYDAQPIEARDGNIAITLDRRYGKSGTLFIANSGSPFTEQNVKGLCEIGLSPKPLGQSIGNKGLGFRSVIQITDAPKVYSQCPTAPDDSCYSGFCLRFAESNDYPGLIDDPRHLRLAEDDLPMFHVPFWVDTQSDAICAFAKAGFSTVIELPLRDEDALGSTVDEIKRLQAQEVPLLLFLDRVSSIKIRIIDNSGHLDLDFMFTRSHEALPTREMELSRVDLGKAGAFLVARRSVPEAKMKDAISTGISRRELADHWAEWQGKGEVAVATRLDAPATSPRLYTFLPMGQQATAPFPGYLHGSFFPSSSRKSLNAEIRLNAMLLAEASKLAANTVLHITADSRPRSAAILTVEQRATAVADMLSWENVDSLLTDTDLSAGFVEQLVAYFKVECFDDVPAVPCCSSTSSGLRLTWRAPRAARCWPTETESFSSKVATRFADITGIWPIWDFLEPRIHRLDEFIRKHSDTYTSVPCAQERALLVSLVAKDLAGRRCFPEKKWIGFYEELQDFMDRDGSQLSGQSILLGDDGRLHPAMSPAPATESSGQSPRRSRRKIERAVFSPPDPSRTSGEDDLEIDPPSKLAERFAFLDMKLPWHAELGEARTFLETHKLVEEFDREAVLSFLSRTLQDEQNKEVLRSGLRWAFQLWRQAKAQGRPVTLRSQHRFRVPTLSGNYVDAREVVFSGKWPAETVGPLLQSFLDAAPKGIPDLARLEERRLAAPDHRAFLGKWTEDWMHFLKELGVESGLVPELKSTSTASFWVDGISNFSFVDDYGISTEFGEFWREDIAAQDPSLLSLPTSGYYLIKGGLSWLPGQAAVDRFSKDCSVLYAELVFDWLARNSEIPWDIVIHHQTYHKHARRVWPTPLKSFLRSARWLPVEESSASASGSTLLRPCDVWMDDDDGESFKAFLPKPLSKLRRLFDGDGGALARSLKDHGGLRILNDPSTLIEQVEFLAQQYTRSNFDRHFEPHLFNLYERTWLLLSRVMNDPEHDDHGNAAPRFVLVRRGHVLERMTMFRGESSEGELVYVGDTRREADIALLEASGRPFVSVRDVQQIQAIGELFEGLYGERIRRLSRVTHSVLADGRDINECATTPALQICPRLRAMVAVAMEALTGTEAQRLPSDRAAILAKLEHFTMMKAESLEFTIDGMALSVAENSVPSFHFGLDDGRVVIAVQSSGEWRWELVDLGIPALCEALGHRALAPYLRLLVEELRNGERPDVAIPRPSEDVERFCSKLHLPASARNAARNTLSAGAERHAPWIRTVLHSLAGSPAVDAFDAEGDEVFRDTLMLEDTLSRLLADAGVSGGELLEICRRAVGAEDFREGLDLNFESFNKSLEELGLDPLTYPELHRSELKSFLAENEIKIIDSLRRAYAPQLNKLQPATGYAVKRDAIRNLTPDPAWLSRYKELPEQALIDRVNAWLEDNSAPPLGEGTIVLEPLAQVRTHNQKFAIDFAHEAIPCIRAWCAKYQPDSLDVEVLANKKGGALHKLLDDVGVRDFRTLDEAALLKWLRILEIWPCDMPPSLDLKVLGLSQEDLSFERARERQEREAQERKRRSVSLNGRMVDPEEVDLIEISKEIHSELMPEVIRMSLGSTSELEEVARSGPSRSSQSGNRHRGAGRTRAPPKKTEFIGRLGELVVYHWLKNILPNQDIEAAWRSENGAHITGRDGDDGLGYDFEVTYRRQSWQIEVKASLEDPQSFEMGETEVRAAREAARTRSGVQYKIAYVSNVQDTKKTRIEVLPNPLADEGARHFQLRGEGIRYGFSRVGS